MHPDGRDIALLKLQVLSSKMQTNLDVEFKKPTYYFDTRPRAMVNANKCPKSDLNLEFENI